MEEPDFSGIKASRVPEARRRIAAINQLLALHDPSTADVDRIASGIGLSRSTFYNLARVWREHRDARLLVVGKRGTATRDYGLDDTAVEITRTAIDGAGATAELATLAPEIERLCAEAGVPAPARPTIWRWMRKARARTGTEVPGPPRIVIGRISFHLPVQDRPTDAMPSLLVAVLMPERHIVAHVVSVDPDSPPSVAKLVAKMVQGRTPGAPARPLAIESDDRRAAADALADAGLGGVVSTRRSGQRELSRAFGDRIGPLKAVYRRALARPANRPQLRQDEPISAQAAVEAIEAAIDASNASMLASAPAFDVANG